MTALDERPATDGSAFTDPATTTVTVAGYLGTRLQQLGVDHLFGVPGDFNLDLLDGLAVGGPAWVGSPNELGAGYAADAYARSRGLGVVVTTYGVGELSAINALAGAYAEDVPLVQVVGAPRRAAVEAGALVHHTLADGDFGHFTRAAAEVTVAAETLTADRAAAQIDAVLLAAVTARKPGYLAVPQDLALAEVDAAPLAERLVARSDDAALAAFEAGLAEQLAGAECPVLLVGQLVPRFGLGRELADLAARHGVAVVTQLSARGVLDPDHPSLAGSYAGGMLEPAARAVVERADVVVHVGTVLTSELTGFGSHRRPGADTPFLAADRAGFGASSTGCVLLPDALAALDRALAGRVGPRFAAPAPEAPEAPAAGGPLTQAQLWHLLGGALPSGTALLADTGTAYWGALGMPLPADTVFGGQPIWSSIGYALPAVLGQGLADRGRRPVLVIGDGAAQMTVQELSTIAAAGLTPVVLLVDNAGYTIERALQSPRAAYNDVAAWDWGMLVAGFTGGRAAYAEARDDAALAAALDAAFADTGRMHVVRAVLDADDTPPLIDALAALATAAKSAV
ncbi:thiamine pyrophosphate-binding protein [Klenkia sp. PcliD-1-E]|uniref:thiamine pyrophosphate-binding protein n=1 Tax=Klenkia sp. PcliD-1-E TaxID=2954492 RepID=UPI002097D0DB|nr:thiamine pyrophosphate-binding protein [Klenkia sp. PcliD-1-E]MCO7221745.1 thiamine pyrophosphate-binding protein [Klenkia sp. PcliD-1-E]